MDAVTPATRTSVDSGAVDGCSQDADVVRTITPDTDTTGTDTENTDAGIAEAINCGCGRGACYSQYATWSRRADTDFAGRFDND